MAVLSVHFESLDVHRTGSAKDLMHEIFPRRFGGEKCLDLGSVNSVIQLYQAQFVTRLVRRE